MFVVGDRVRWRSASGGKVREKVGEVVAVVPCNIIPESRFGLHTYGFMRSVLGQGWREKYSLDRMGGGSRRPCESYLIAVKTGKTNQALLRLYWPYAYLLEKIDDDF